jgi:tetratricopeptide (TPR) repeat protein
MIRLHGLRAVLRCATFALVASGFALAPTAFAQDTVRPEVGKPLKEAGEMMKAGKNREALGKINEADAVGGKTAYESFLITRMRGSAAAAAGDNDTAIKSFETVIASGRVTGADQLRMVQAVAGMYYRNKDYPKAAQWAQRYMKDGGTDPGVRTILVQSYFLTNDCANVSRLVGGNAEESTRKAPEEELQMLANCYNKQKDNGGYVAAIEKLVTHYPKKEYWTDLLNRVQKKPGFSDRLAIDVYRLKQAIGTLVGPTEYMEMAQLAIQAGVPSEAKAVVEKGYANGTLGKDKDADRQKRLRDVAAKAADEALKARPQAEKDAQDAKDGTALFNVGMNYAAEGQADKGAALMDQAIKKGGLKHPDEAKLQLGVVQVKGGQAARGVQTLRSVKGTDGSADLARLWILNAGRS